MKIKIHIPEGLDKNDRKIIELLEIHPVFQEKIKATRIMFGIPAEGLDEESFHFENDYLTDNSGKKVKLVRNFPKVGTEESFNCFDKFLDDPDYFLAKKRKFRKEIEKIAKEFSLGKNWYHALCHIVLFSTAEWLPFPINAVVRDFHRKSVWHPSGIVLEITKNVSKKQFVKWLNENWDNYRERLNKELNIAKDKGIFKDEFFELTKEIIELRNQGTTFEEISTRLLDKYEDKYKPESEEYELLVSPKAIQDRYYRFLKLFRSNPHKK